MTSGVIRAARGIPACVWIINRHSEKITVVVSKYGPNRLLSGVEATGSATGGGLKYSTTVSHPLSALSDFPLRFCCSANRQVSIDLRKPRCPKDTGSSEFARFHSRLSPLDKAKQFWCCDHLRGARHEIVHPE